jgi:hypothetical protein
MIKPTIDGAPGLCWRKRGEGYVAYWVARADLARRGYATKTARLWPPTEGCQSNPPTEQDAIFIRGECQRLQDQMLVWGRVGEGLPVFDGTLMGLIEAYRRDQDSPYNNVRYYTRQGYDSYLRLLEKKGARALAALGAKDFLRWYDDLKAPLTADGAPRVYHAHALITMLRSLISFGVTFEIQGCNRLDTILGKMRFENGVARTEAISAEQAVTVRAVARARGARSIALAQAFQFELTMRQKDVIGEWLPIAEPGLSDIQAYGDKWLMGLRWEEISPDLILRHRLSKSIRGRGGVLTKRGKVKEFDLKLYPMIMEELSLVPPEARHGALIINEATGLPYRSRQFGKAWRPIATAAGVPVTVKNMDSRAGGITEGDDATDGDLEAAGRSAGHSNTKITQRYVRGRDLKKNSEVAHLRVAFRGKATDGERG